MGRSWMLLAFLFVMVSGCSGPTIDSSSNTTFEASTMAIENELSPTDAVQFRKALQVILTDGVRMSLGNSYMEQIANNQERIDGYDVAEVIALAEEIRSE